MRPRVFPAEDIMAIGSLRDGGAAVASMRPRVFPAEDGIAPSHQLERLDASMRPRVFPAEDVIDHAAPDDVRGLQ